MDIARTFRYAGRQLRKAPVLTFTVITTLALCIGVNTAIFSVVYALFLRPLPYPDPQRLTMLCTVHKVGGASEIDNSQDGRQWELIRDHASFLDGAVLSSTNGINIAANHAVRYVQDQRVSANFFHVLGVKPLIGREWTRAEDVPNGPSLALLSYGLWQGMFAADPSIVGRTIEIRGIPHTVVGIMPAGFQPVAAGPDSDLNPDLWTPLHPSSSGEGSGTNYGVIARLKPNVSFAQANAQLNAILHEYFESQHLPSSVTVREEALPLQAGITTDVSFRVRLMWTAVLLLLLIGCINIAALLLARSATRSREMATRLALGAPRSRLVIELFSEAVLLAIAGAAAGVLLGQFAIHGLLALNPGDFTLTGPVRLSLPVIATMMGISLATSILFGLFPAWEGSKVDIRAALAEAGRTQAGSRRQWTRQSLVFAQLTLGVMLLIAAGLLIRTLANLMGADAGFNPNGLVVASASLQDQRYATAAAGARLFRETILRIEQIPGVESAAVALTPPYRRPLNDGISGINGKPVPDGITDFNYATPGLFHTLGMHLLRGRLFDTHDIQGAPLVAVVNEAFVRRYLRNSSKPLATSIRIENKDWQIIGIVNDVQEQNGIGFGGPVDRFPEVYVPVDQFPDGIFAMANVWFSPVWIIRTKGPNPALARSVQRALATIDPHLPVSSFQSMSHVRGSAFQQQRYQAVIFSVVAAFAMLLTALGLYGMIAQSVAQRTREMGIRLALGATTARIIAQSAKPGILLGCAGIFCGCVLALFATPLLKSLIWGVPPSDPLTFLVVAGFLILVTAIASVLPALRLARLDAAQTFRSE